LRRVVVQFYFAEHTAVADDGQAPIWVVKTGVLKKTRKRQWIKWTRHSGPFALRAAADEYAALVRKMEPHHKYVEVFSA
jgi:hypothetical protein